MALLCDGMTDVGVVMALLCGGITDVEVETPSAKNPELTIRFSVKT